MVCIKRSKAAFGGKVARIVIFSVIVTREPTIFLRAQNIFRNLVDARDRATTVRAEIQKLCQVDEKNRFRQKNASAPMHFLNVDQHDSKFRQLMRVHEIVTPARSSALKGLAYLSVGCRQVSQP